MNDTNEKTPLFAGLAAARINLIPGLMIQAIMLGVVLAYYHHEPARRLLGSLAGWKQRYGYAFAFVATGIGGGILPEIFRVLVFQRGAVRRENLVGVLFGFPFWGIAGCCVDTLYRYQAVWFGIQATAAVVVKKVAVDMFIFTPIWGTPYVVWGYEWKLQGFSCRKLWRFFTPTFYRFTILPALIAGWAVWIPAVSIIYSLPPLLQIPLFVLATSFWSLLVACISSNKAHLELPPP